MPKTVMQAQWSLGPYRIGLKLRSLRIQKRLTLSRLAAETGLSTGLLSKLETGRMIPTLPTLGAICRVYGVTLGYFFSEPAHHALGITRRGYLEADGQGPEPVKITPLNPRESRLLAQVIDLQPATPATVMDAAHQRAGVLYVLEGRLRLESEGLSETLEAGDCAWVESDAIVAWSAADRRRCRILAIAAGAAEGAGERCRAADPLDDPILCGVPAKSG